MTYDGAKTYGYDFANRLTSVSGSPTTNLSYDPAGRLYEVAGSSTTRFVYDGLDMIAEYNTAGNVLRRYIHGPGLDEPLVWYEGSSTGDRRHLYADERGSVVAMEGGSVAVNTYGPFGEPGAGNTGRFQYTGQMWLPEAGLYHYKARAYHPDLGRFMQTDPIGYGDGMNMYAYVGNDPMNFLDPTGTKRLECWWHDYPNPKYDEEEIPRVQIDGFRSEVFCAWMPEIQDFFADLFWGLPLAMLGDGAKAAGCTAGNLDFGGGIDAYAGVGGSVGGSFKADFTTGQVGADAYLAVGFGSGGVAGPTVTASSSGNSILTANVITQVGGGVGTTGTVTHTLLGTNPNQTSLTLGKAGTPIGFTNVGGAVGVHTPQLYDLGC